MSNNAEMAVVHSLLFHLEEEHRHGNISDETYSELKSNYEGKIKEMLGTHDDVSDDIKMLKAKLGGEAKAEPTEFQDTVKAPSTAEVKDVSAEKKIGHKKFLELSFIKRIFRNPEKKSAPAPSEPVLEKEPQNPVAANQITVQALQTTQAVQTAQAQETAQAQATHETPAPEKDEQPAEDQTDSDQKTHDQDHAEGEKKESGESKGGLLKKLFHKNENEKEEKKEEKKEEAQDAETQATTAAPAENETKEVKQSDIPMEIEKIKMMLDTIRETKKSTDETISNIFESLGELRSTTFQIDGALKENVAKMERMTEDIVEINPKNFLKKINDVNSAIEKHGLVLEKLETKTGDLAEKVNHMSEMLSTIGNVENLERINKDVQQKIGDINELVKYIERISSKAEKTYLDLNERLNDFVLYKSKQDSLDDTSKDLLRSVDRLGLNFENYAQKKELDSIREEIILLQAKVHEVSNSLPIVSMKIPEDIELLKREKDDIEALLKSLGEQAGSGKIDAKEFESIKKKNEEKLASIEKDLSKEWARFMKTVAKAPRESKTEPKEEVQPSAEAAPAEIKDKEEAKDKEETKKETEPKKEPKHAKEHEKKKAAAEN